MLTTQLTTIIATVGGLVVPLLVSLLKKVTWSAQIKQLIAGLISLAVAAIAIWIVNPSLFGLPFATLAALVYAASQFAYGLYFKGSSVDTILTAAIYKKPASTTKKAIAS